MIKESIAEDNAPAKHAVPIAWFQGDPGGTIFIVPPGGTAASKSIIEEGGDGVTSPHN
jgi:hypothetical protein